MFANQTDTSRTSIQPEAQLRREEAQVPIVIPSQTQPKIMEEVASSQRANTNKKLATLHAALPKTKTDKPDWKPAVVPDPDEDALELGLNFGPSAHPTVYLKEIFHDQGTREPTPSQQLGWNVDTVPRPKHRLPSGEKQEMAKGKETQEDEDLLEDIALQKWQKRRDQRKRKEAADRKAFEDISRKAEEEGEAYRTEFQEAFETIARSRREEADLERSSTSPCPTLGTPLDPQVERDRFKSTVTPEPGPPQVSPGGNTWNSPTETSSLLHPAQWPQRYLREVAIWARAHSESR